MANWLMELLLNQSIPVTSVDKEGMSVSLRISGHSFLFTALCAHLIDLIEALSQTRQWLSSLEKEIKGEFHQHRSNLGSAEPGSTLIVDLNQVQVMKCSTNVKLGSADVVQLNHDGYTSWTLIGPI